VLFLFVKVRHKELLFVETVQKVEIYYKMIGFIDLPEMSKSQKEILFEMFWTKRKRTKCISDNIAHTSF